MKRILTSLAAICCFLAAFAQWAQVNTSVAHVRTHKGHSQEMCTQEYMGMPVKVVSSDGGWSEVVTTDGYKGWINSKSLVPMTDDELSRWKRSPRLVVTSMAEVVAYDAPDACGPMHRVAELVPCDIVLGSLDSQVNQRVKITLPDGRVAWADAAAFSPIEQWASQPFDADKILAQAFACYGVPYTWGGNSPKGLDCSGLAKLSYLSCGIFLRRDAWMQAQTGKAVDMADWDAYMPADLVFFGNHDTGKVTHVGIIIDGNKYIESSGKDEMVSINSLKPVAEQTGKTRQLHVRRINGSEGTDGIVKAINHPWLF